MDLLISNELPIELMYGFWISTDNNLDKLTDIINKNSINILINLSNKLQEKKLNINEKLNVKLTNDITDLDESYIYKSMNIIVNLIEERIYKFERVFILCDTNLMYGIFIYSLLLKRVLKIPFDNSLECINTKLQTHFNVNDFNIILLRIYNKFQ